MSTFVIPKKHLDQVRRELDDEASWDKSSAPALWVLLNKLKIATNYPEDCTETKVSWDDLEEEDE